MIKPYQLPALIMTIATIIIIITFIFISIIAIIYSTIETLSDVETIVTCPLTDLLYDSTGRINKEKLKDFVRDKSKQVIGWFCFRRNTSNLIPTMRDKVLHKQFASHFSSGNNCREDFFLTCLLNASTSETRGTHKFRHVFLRRKQG